jgi:hypothetical protein
MGALTPTDSRGKAFTLHCGTMGLGREPAVFNDGLFYCLGYANLSGGHQQTAEKDISVELSATEPTPRPVPWYSGGVWVLTN